MIISTHTITEEYRDGTLVIPVLDTDRGGTISTISAVQEAAIVYLQEKRMTTHDLGAGGTRMPCQQVLLSDGLQIYIMILPFTFLFFFFVIIAYSFTFLY